MKYRSRIDVISKILDAANGCNVTKMKITYKVLLHLTQLKENLMLLTQHNLLRYDKDTQTFRTTYKGMRFLQIYNQLDELINGEKEQQPLLARKIGIHR
jgi:predicted transcriptional regulator